jgi:hypothetical protein
MKTSVFLISALLGSLGACASAARRGDNFDAESLAHAQSAAPNACAPIDTAVERFVTVRAGAYGQLVAGCDTPDCCDTVMGPGAWGVGVFSSLPVPGGEAAPLAFAAPSTDGLYELALMEGSYVFCTGESLGAGRMRVEGACTNASLGAGLTRIDWTSGPGGGHWSPSANPCNYPPSHNDPRCPSVYAWAYAGQSCPAKGLTCAYPGVGDEESNGCFATAMLWCYGNGGVGDLGDGGSDSGPGTWTAAQ